MRTSTKKPTLLRLFLSLLLLCVFLVVYTQYSDVGVAKEPQVSVYEGLRYYKGYWTDREMSDGKGYVMEYEQGLELVRRKVLSQHDTNLTNNCRSAINLMRASSVTFLETMAKTTAETVELRMDYSAVKDIVRDQYFQPISNNCTTLHSRANQVVLNKTGCKHEESVEDLDLLREDLKIGLPMQDTQSPLKYNDSVLLTYLHVIPHGSVNTHGDVVFGDTRFIPIRCQQPERAEVCAGETAYHQEIFSIAQFWGYAFFHSTLENLPRLLPYLNFLKNHPHIKVHVWSRSKFLPLLGITGDRLVTGTVSARVLYIPAGTPCGEMSLFSGQMLSKTLRQHVQPAAVRRTVVLIRRSAKRQFKHHASILQMLQQHARDMNLTVEVYPDNPVPDILATLDMFNRAVIVIAPHGAGEANLVLSQPGTVLIEGACYMPKMVLCYQTMARRLGLRYYGLALNKQCFDITAEDVEKPFLKYTKLLGFSS